MSFRDPLEAKKAGDVASLSLKIRGVIPCGICAMGIAIDLAERYWHNGSHDYKASGHACRVVEKGLTSVELKLVEAIEAEYMGRERAA